MMTPAQVDWVMTQLSANSYTLQGNIELAQERAWSQVATVPTTQGKLYTKMTCPK